MASGSLASIRPTVASKNQVLYTAPQGKLVEGKVYVTNLDSSDVKIRIGLSTDGLSAFNPNAGYVVFEQVIPSNQYFQSDSLFFADGQSLIVRSDSINTKFTLLGVETENRESAGFLAQGTSLTDKSSTLLFTVPTDYKQFRGSLFVCNRGSFDTRIRVGLGTTSTDYLEYNYIVKRGSTHFRSDLRAVGGDVLYIRADQDLTNFVLTGYYENFIAFPGDVGIGSTVQAQNAYIKSKVSIGISSPGSSTLKVIGNTSLVDLDTSDSVRIGKDLSVAGFSTFANTVTFNGGTVNLGINTQTSVVLNANVSSNVTPTTTNTYDLGIDSQRWRYIYSSDTIVGKNVVLTGVSTIGTVGAGATQTQIVVGGANTSIVTSNSVAINGDLILKGQVGVGTTTQSQLRYDETTDQLQVWNKSLSRWLPVMGVDDLHVTVTSNYTARAFSTIWFDNITGGAFTITLPSSPSQGDRIRFVDVVRGAATNNLTIARNGQPIMGDADNLTVSSEGASFEMMYYNGTRGWVVLPV
jgi:hypothetical protein